jgi:hypothetical protein
MNNIFKATDRFGNETEFEVIDPTVAVEREADMQYRIAFNEALKHGLMPREKMRTIMSDQEIWAADDEDKLKNVLARLAMGQVSLATLEAAGKTDECIKVAEQMFKDRNEMWQLLMIQQSAFVNSAEGMAETIKYDATMCGTLVIRATGTKYWKNYKEYVIERDENEQSTVIDNLESVYTSIEIAKRDEMLSVYPERKWVTDRTEEILADDDKIQEEASKVVKKRRKKAVGKKKKVASKK